MAGNVIVNHPSRFADVPKYIAHTASARENNVKAFWLHRTVPTPAPVAVEPQVPLRGRPASWEEGAAWAGPDTRDRSRGIPDPAAEPVAGNRAPRG